MRNRSGLLSSIVTATMLAGVAPGYGKAPPFVDGDRVAFIGDSITHGGSYHAYVYDFYLTRFPAARVTFLNCGISGDSAGGATARFEWDILAKRPTTATIMLGMNDVGRDAYGVEAPSTQQANQRKWALDGYRANMERLIGQLVEHHIPVTLITPSPYDQTARLPEKNLFGVNDALATCGQFARDTAQQRGFGLIDFNGPLTALNAEYEKTEATKTLIGPDRVHPGELGHFLMAYYFLKAQGMTPVVASVAIDAQKQEVTEQTRCTAKLMEANGNGLSYAYTAESLPFPTNPVYRDAEALVPFSRDLNVERICVTGLAEGEYDLSVDGTLLGTFNAEDLSAGINIATNPASPMQQQAQTVHAKSMERHANAQSLRTIAMMEAGMHQAKIDMANAEAVERYFVATRVSVQGKPWEGYINDQIKAYGKLKPREEEITKTVESLEDTLYTMNRPAAHTVVIKRK